MSKLISICIPCFNEEKSLLELGERLKKLNNVITKKYDGEIKLEVILINNGSEDYSSEIIYKLENENKFIRSVNILKNRGYGFGIKSGLRVANGDYIGWTHADLQTDVIDIQKAIHILINSKYSQKIYIKGSRKGRALFDNAFTFAMSIIESILFRVIIFDINAQPNILPRSFLSDLEYSPNDFSFDLYFYIKAIRSSLTVKRFTVNFPPRKYGISSWNKDFFSKIKFIKRTLSYSIKLLKSGI